MKVLMLANSDLGLYKFRKELLERLTAEKHDVAVCLPSGQFIPALQKIGCRYINIEFARRGTNPIADLKQCKAYVSLLKREKPDVVLTYTVKPNIYGGLACRLRGTPFIANVTGLGTSIENPGMLQKITLTLYRMGLKSARCVFFQNEPHRATFSHKGIVHGKSSILPGSGVNIAENKYEQYPSEKDGLRFLFVGRVMRDKGINELLCAAASIKARHPNCTFTVIGACDEDYTEQLNSLAQKRIIRYLGFQKNIHEHIANHHCTILPSYHEGTANVLLESASAGRPVIATRVTGCMETFDEGITGVGCKAKSAEDLTHAIEAFLKMPESKHIEMGKAGRKKMEKEFDRSIVVDKYIAEIGRIIGENTVRNTISHQY